MALHIPAGYGLVAYRFRLAGDPEEMITTIGVDNVGPGVGNGNAEDLSDEFKSAFSTASLTADYTFMGTKLYMDDGAGGTAVFQHDTVYTGTNGDSSMPSNCAFLVTKRTALGGRRYRGRMYLPACFIGEGSVSALGGMSGAAIAIIQAKLDAWLITPPGYPKVLLHDVSPANPVPLAPTPITTVSLEPIIATQRRRLRR